MKIHTQFEQGSACWTEARLGKVTASEFKNLITPGFKARTGEMPHSYLCLKLREKLCGPRPAFTTYVTEQGSLREEDAIPWYALEYDCDVKRIGFVEHEDGRCGCSPDGIINDGQSGLEIKCAQPETHIKYCLAGELPDDYAPQVHFSLYVTGYDRWTFLSYCPVVKERPGLVVTVARDETKIKAIEETLAAFYAKFDAALQQFTTNGKPQ